MPKKLATTTPKDVPAEAQVHEYDYEPPVTRTTAKTFLTFKKAVLKQEENNYNRLYFFPCSGNDDWRMAGGHSALIYYYHVIVPLNKKVRFVEDESKFPPLSSTGVIIIKGTKTVRKRLQQLELYKAEYHKNGLVIFYLTRTFTKRDIELLWKKEQDRRERLNSIIVVKKADPELSVMVMNATKRLYHVCETKLKVFASRTIGVKIVDLLQQLVDEQYKLTDTTDKKQLQQGWKRMSELVRQILYALQTINSWEIWSKEKCASVAQEFVAIAEYLDKKLDNETN